jgi:hypothetical protein
VVKKIFAGAVTAVLAGGSLGLAAPAVAAAAGTRDPQPVIATFFVHPGPDESAAQTFKAKLTDASEIRAAFGMLQGTRHQSFPTGIAQRGEEVNTGHAWHLESVRFFDWADPAGCTDTPAQLDHLVMASQAPQLNYSFCSKFAELVSLEKASR